MGMNDRFRVSHKSLLLASLLCVVLVSSLFVCLFVNVTSGAFLENAVHVKNETELKDAINNAPDGKSTTIALDNDITLTSYDEQNHIYNYRVATLIIPANKDITLTSNKANGFYKLIGAVHQVDTILVGNDGVLRLDGIIVTHKKGATDSGVHVLTKLQGKNSGILYLYSGEISGNTVNNSLYGGGVVNAGTFIMTGGKITGNSAESCGGGVYNSGIFEMSGGEISGNTAGGGGGVCNGYYAQFTMSGGVISGNTASVDGGGVYTVMYSEFIMLGGEISGNSAEEGGGVYIYDATFDRRGGVISGNTAMRGDNDVFHSGDNNGPTDGNNGSVVDGFSLGYIVITCVITAAVTICITLVVLHLSSKKRLNQ